MRNADLYSAEAQGAGTVQKAVHFDHGLHLTNCSKKRKKKRSAAFQPHATKCQNNVYQLAAQKKAESGFEI